MIVGCVLTRPWPVFDIPPAITVVLTCLLAASTLGLALPVLAVIAWRRGWWTRGRRVHFTLVALAVVVIPWLSSWNLLGYRY